ncbi:MAG: HD domain-containing protein [Thermodesulfobacteriota bacterium]|nr:HD domain-containing protein [Thermodesulfobacteriota bacterium]
MINYIYDSIENMGSENGHIFQEIALLALKITNGKGCFLALFDEENDEFHLRVARGSASRYCRGNQIPPPLDIISRKVVRNRKASLVNSDNTELRDSAICVPLMIRSRVFGVLGLTGKKDGGKFTREDLGYIRTLVQRASLNLENKILYESLYANILDTFKSLITSIQLRDHYTEIHSAHVTELAVKTAKAFQCSEKEIESLKIAGMLHDIGKIAIPDKILLKEDRLTDEEYTIIKNHSIIGENILKPVVLIDTERKIIRHHHERWDGKGYPDGLSDENIPFLSRILNVADSFDAMTSNRPYQKVMRIEDAICELQRNRNTQFDKNVVDAFVESGDCRI